MMDKAKACSTRNQRKIVDPQCFEIQNKISIRAIKSNKKIEAANKKIENNYGTELQVYKQNLKLQALKLPVKRIVFDAKEPQENRISLSNCFRLNYN